MHFLVAGVFSTDSRRRQCQHHDATTDQKITGSVNDAQGPIVGATVRIRGTQVAVITDVDGKFSINAPQGATMQVSYVGFVEKEFRVDSRSNYDITLVQDNNALEEVVVVGYGTMKKSDVAGASSTLDEKALRELPVTNIDQSFQGKVTGVTAIQTSGAPGSSTSIRVRGQATINAGAEPLYVIDGVIVQGGGQSGADFGLADALGNGRV